jgi:acetoin:2,6-dichlorophenolindophenol oxidoreductase subunit beta
MTVSGESRVPRTLSYAEAVNDALHVAMASDPSVLCYGLGVDDPKTIFGTTKGLQERFGEQRVFDMPTAEAAMTGIAIGAALGGMRPVMVHQRLDFFLLAMDQLVNAAAKWHYMFGGQRSVPITIRLILGRGWGQGPTHSQSLHAWFAHIPGLKVVMPTNPEDAKGLLLESIFDPNPVLFFEHRWLHNTVGPVPEGDYRIPLGKARRLREGDAVTIVSMSYMTVEALHAVDHLRQAGVSCDLLDLRSVSPLDWEAVFASVRRTGRLLVLDTAAETGSIAGEIVARAAIECWDALKSAPQRITMPDIPEPTSFGLTRGLHPRAEQIVAAVAGLVGKPVAVDALIARRTVPHDVPGDWFKGPF